MTQDQKIELEYLIDLLREATKWKVEEGDDAVRLEVDLRINNILNGEEPDDSLTEDQTLDSIENEPKPWQQDKIRVHVNGKVIWKPKSQCHKEPRDKSRGGSAWHWVWNDPDSTKAEQVNAMWAEHEQV